LNHLCSFASMPLGRVYKRFDDSRWARSSTSRRPVRAGSAPC